VSPGNAPNCAQSRVEGKAFISCSSDDPVNLMYQNNGEKERTIQDAVKAMLQGPHPSPGETLAGPQQNSSSSTAPAAPVQSASSNDVTLPGLPGVQSVASSASKQAATQNGSGRPSHAGGNNPFCGPPGDAKSSCRDADDGAVGGTNGAGPTERLEVTAFFSWQSDVPVLHQDPLTALLGGAAKTPAQQETE